MSMYLLQLALGPVQEFIAQARRSRDLWHGSHLLSEISRRAAATVARNGGQLIFPAIADQAPLNVANIILAELDGDEATVRKLAEAVRDEVQRFWAETAERVKSNCGGLIAPRIDAAWKEQIDTFLEFAAAWTPIGDDYAAARKRLVDAIAGRKNLRDFEPWKAQREKDGLGVPKSSL